ncbi:MAG: tripartite tricarboxylate transporter substrate binding protein [Burkholderiaceae bacterium]|nr:tripartite tricarboxylate transporter substrate binding protein [Burkholderiaceae bacterium]
MNFISKKTFLICIFAITSGFSIAQNTRNLPLETSKSTRLLVGGGPGSIADMLARPLADVMSKSLHQPIIVDNKPSAGGLIAITELLRNPADGQTLLMISATAVAWNQYLFKKLPYDPEFDIIPVAPIAAIPMILAVNPSVSAKSIEEFIALARKEPRKYTFGFGGNGTPSHVSFERFRSSAGIDMVPVPYRSGPNALQDLIGGQIDSMLDGVPLLESHIKSGRLRALAVATKKRIPSLPDVPTLIEKGFHDFEATIWVGIGVKKGTDPRIVQKLNIEINKALDSPGVQDVYTKMGAQVRKSSQKEFSNFIKSERAMWGPVIKNANITLE